MAELIIIGAGGHGKVVADCAQATGRWQQIRFLDSHYPEKTKLLHFNVIDTPDNFAKYASPETYFFVAIGNNDARRLWLNRLSEQKLPIASVVHPQAVVSDFASIGEGCLIVAGAIVNADAEIHRGGIINTAASVDHDCVLNEVVHIAPGARLAGTVSIGEASFVGAGSVIIPNIKVGKRVVVGAGATVTRNIGDDSTVVGTPAKSIK